MPLVGTAPPLHAPKPSVKQSSAKSNYPTPEEQKNSKRTERATGLNNIAQVISAGLVMFGQFADSEAIATYAPGVCYQSAIVAEDHESFANFLDQADVATPYVALAMATIPLALQIMVNHGRIKPEKASGMGVMSPEMLETRAKARLAKRQAEMLRQQRQFEEQARAEYEAYQAEYEREVSLANGSNPDADV
jgi:hypothetical protein